MSTQTPLKRVLFPRTLAHGLVGGFVALALLFAFIISTTVAVLSPTPVAAATNSTLSFQARLENSAGNIAPDGYYNVQFKLYSASSGGTALWTETYFDANGVTAGSDARIQVKNGYLTANLGSQSAFPSTINWNEELWITMNIGGTVQTATPTWDGEMNPRLKLTGVPYAFRAGQLATTHATNGFTSTLSLLQPTVGNQVFQIPDQAAAGTYSLCVQGSTSGCNPGGGSSFYVQNQNAAQQGTSNFWISGTGRADTALQAPLIDTATGVALNIGTTNATAINLNQNVTVANGRLFTAGGKALFRNDTNSADAFQIQNVAGVSLLTVDTTTLNMVTNSSFETDTSGWNAKGTATLSQTTAQAIHGFESLQAVVSAASSGVTTNAFTAAITASTQYEVTFMARCAASHTSFTYGRQDVSGTDINATTTATCNTNWQRYTFHYTTGATITSPNIYMTLGTTTSGTIFVDAVQLLQTTTNGAQPYSAGSIRIGGVITDPVVIRNTSNSTNSFEVQNAAGTGNNFVVDTVNSRINMNTGGYGASLNVGGTSTFRTTTNSVNGFQIQNSSGWQLLNVDTVLPAVNLVTNPGFESNTTGWANKTGGTLTRTTTANALYFGVAAGQLALTGANGGTSFNATLTLGNTYNLSFYARANGSNATDIVAGYTNGAGDNNCLASQTVVTGGFTRYSCSFTVSGTAGTAVYIKQGSALTQTLYIDGVQLLNGATAPVPYSLGNISLRGTINSPVSFRSTTDSTTALQIQNAAGTNNLFITDTLNNRIAIGQATAAYTLDINGDINISGSSVYRFGGTAGATTTCTGGQFMQNQVVLGGIVTGGTCAAAGSSTLQQAYNISTDPEIIVDNTRGGLTIKDSATPITLNGGRLFEVLNNANTALFSVNTGGATIGGNLSLNGTVSGGTTYTAVTGMQAPLYDTASASLLNIGTTNATGINLNKNVTVAAGQSLTLAGGITGTRPASPSEGTLYYDTTTKQLLVYANGKWQADRSTSTRIIAANDSPNKDSADYVVSSADETAGNADATINAAIATLPSTGGSIYLMEGTYTVDGSISLPNNTMLSGAGNATVIKVKNAVNASISVITNSDTLTGTHITIKDLRIDGNRANQTAGTQTGIYMNNVGSGFGTTAKSGVMISGVNIRDTYSRGIWFVTTVNSTVSGSTMANNGTTGILAQSNSSNLIITNNLVQGNGVNGIEISSTNASTVTGNNVQGNLSTGIYLTSANDNTVSGNAVNTNAYGIVLSNTVGANVNGNKFHMSGGSTTNNAVYIFNTSNNNSIVNNDVTDDSCTTSCYAINITVSTSANNYLSNNRHSTASGTSTIQDLGTGTIYSNQLDAAGYLINRSGGGLQVQSSTAVSLLTADTTNMRVNVGTAATYLVSAVSTTISIAAKVDYATTANANTVTAADFNGDGIADLASATSTFAADYMSIRLNNGNGTFGARADYTLGDAGQALVSGDFDADGDNDVAVATDSAMVISVFMNNGNGTFAAKVDYGGGDSMTDLVARDFNGDGKLDLAASSYFAHSVVVLMNNGNGTFAALVSYFGTNYPTGIASGDFNGDGNYDLVVPQSDWTGVHVLMNNGNGTFAAPAAYTMGAATSVGVAVADLNNDGRDDILAPSSSGNVIMVLINNGNGTFGASASYASGTAPFRAEAGDLNGDGYADLVSANNTANTISVFKNNGNGTFAAKVDYATGTGPRDVVVADLNGNRTFDIAVANRTAGTVSVFMNNLAVTTVNSRMTVRATDTASSALIIQGASGQTADLLRLQNASGTALVTVTASGILQASMGLQVGQNGGKFIVSSNGEVKIGNVGTLTGYTLQVGGLTRFLSSANSTPALVITDGQANSTLTMTPGRYWNGTGWTNSANSFNMDLPGTGAFSLSDNVYITGNHVLCIRAISCGKVLGVNGTIGATGAITANTTPDIAEHIPAAPDVEAADVVMADPHSTERVVKSSGAYTGTALGVISDGTSSFMINPYGSIDDKPSRTDTQPLVLAGRVPVKVTNEGGSIKPGDYLTTSSTPGKAMKATRAGATIGKSLGFFDGTTGTVLALINVSYYDPYDGNNLQATTGAFESLSVGSGNFGSLNVSGNLTTQNLVVNGTAAFKGDVTVTGRTNVQDITINGRITVNGEAPTITVGPAAGQPKTLSNGTVDTDTMPTVMIDGNDTAGSVVVRTGQTGLVTGALMHLNFAKEYQHSYKVVISPTNGEAGKIQAYIVKTQTGFDIVTDTVMTAGKDYLFDYIVLEATVASN